MLKTYGGRRVSRANSFCGEGGMRVFPRKRPEPSERRCSANAVRILADLNTYRNAQAVAQVSPIHFRVGTSLKTRRSTLKVNRPVGLAQPRACAGRCADRMKFH